MTGIGISIPIVLCSNLSYDSYNVFKNICEFIFSIGLYIFLEEPYFLVRLSCFSDLGPKGAQDARQCLAKTPLRAVPILGAPESGYKDSGYWDKGRSPHALPVLIPNEKDRGRSNKQGKQMKLRYGKIED